MQQNKKSEDTGDWLQKHFDAQEILLYEGHNLRNIAKNVSYLFPEMSKDILDIVAELDRAKTLSSESIGGMQEEQLVSHKEFIATALKASLGMDQED